MVDHDYEGLFSSLSQTLPNNVNPVTLAAEKSGQEAIVENYKLDAGSHSEITLEFFKTGFASIEIDSVLSADSPVRETGFRYIGPQGYGVQARVVTVNGTTNAKVHVDGRYRAKD